MEKSGVTEHRSELERLVEEQTALRKIATLVAEGAGENELISAVTSETARLFGADRASVLRWDGDTIRVVGDWNVDATMTTAAGHPYPFGRDTLAGRVVNSEQPARVDSVDEFNTDFARATWREIGIQTAIGAPIIVDGRVWGVMTASRTRPDDPFEVDSEQ